MPADARSEPAVPLVAGVTVERTACTHVGAETREMLAALVAPPSEPERPIPFEFDGLRIVRSLGRGGSSRVYLADEPARARQVAVKVLDRASHAWEREARVVRSLRHPGVVELHRVGVVGDRPYLVYERVPGVSLAHATMPMPAWRVVRIARDLAAALAAVHDAGIVHRDVKPSNVMLAPDPIGRERARLIDFGIAHLAGSAPYVRAGTPRYMAPEALEGARASFATDAFSFALVVLELLTGTLDPRALEALPRGTRRAAWDAPAELVDAIARTLSESPRARLRMPELLALLERL